MRNLIQHRTSRLRRGLSLALLAALLGLGAATLTQCRTTTEPLTGVDVRTAVGTHSRNRCLKECNETYREAQAEERERFEGELKLCDGDRECRIKARETHREIVAKIVAEREECKRSCYNEGAGEAGR